MAVAVSKLQFIEGLIVAGEILLNTTILAEMRWRFQYSRRLMKYTGIRLFALRRIYEEVFVPSTSMLRLRL